MLTTDREDSLYMNASLLVHQQQGQLNKMMLTYPHQSTLLHTRPTLVTSHGVLPQPLNQLPGFPVAIAPTLLQAHIPAPHHHHHHHHTTTPTGLHSPAVVNSNARCEAGSPHGSDKTNCSSPPAAKSTHSSFSIDSILGKKEDKEHASNNNSTNERVHAPAAHTPTRTATTNGLFYFYTPSQPSFPFATTPRTFDQDLQRSPLGSLIIPATSGNYLQHASKTTTTCAY